MSRLLQMGEALSRPGFPTLDMPVDLGCAQGRSADGDSYHTLLATFGNAREALGNDGNQRSER